MKRILSIMMAVLLMACGSAGSENTAAAEPAETAAEPAAVETETAPAAETDAAEGKTLVVVFSATGTTKDIAEKIAAVTNADLYEIKAAQEYTEADLNWHDSRTE